MEMESSYRLRQRNIPNKMSQWRRTYASAECTKKRRTMKYITNAQENTRMESMTEESEKDKLCAAMCELYLLREMNRKMRQQLNTQKETIYEITVKLNQKESEIDKLKYDIRCLDDKISDMNIEIINLKTQLMKTETEKWVTVALDMAKECDRFKDLIYKNEELLNVNISTIKREKIFEEIPEDFEVFLHGENFRGGKEDVIESQQIVNASENEICENITGSVSEDTGLNLYELYPSQESNSNNTTVCTKNIGGDNATKGYESYSENYSLNDISHTYAGNFGFVGEQDYSIDIDFSTILEDFPNKDDNFNEISSKQSNFSKLSEDHEIDFSLILEEANDDSDTSEISEHYDSSKLSEEIGYNKVNPHNKTTRSSSVDEVFYSCVTSFASENDIIFHSAQKDESKNKMNLYSEKSFEDGEPDVNSKNYVKTPVIVSRRSSQKIDISFDFID